MGTFEVISKHGDHEQVVFCNDPHVGLKAIIAIHNTALGPALGGTRMWNYKNEDEALVDVLRLSKGMTYKAAASGLNLGGGKAVIIGDPKTQKSEGLFRAFGQFVNSLNGKYITAEDVGTSVQDMEHIYMETPWVTGIPKDFGGSGDPSPYTAHGVLMGIKASSKEKFGTDALKGLKIAVQGLGNVGSNLVKYLKEEGAEVIVADIDMARTKKTAETFGAKAVSPEEILFVECDILAPCALGAVVNDQTITKLRTKVIAGGANNVLAEAR
ncbi:MAG TPA: Glu/Leu/Phe/Val dehydrogenase dimerization domain-containing protein, partial [Bdellovibrio sp.]|nr:Glu/Leu/Phe/Val dehydrogenase dimerization domain-containing protein [Bdellovibrio sp.]